MSQEIHDHVQELYEQIAELRGRLERMHRPGTITDVDYSDATKPRIRLQVGTDANGQPVKSPWIAHAQHAGARKIHTPFTVGQSVMQIAPAGNFEQALVVPYGFSQPNPSPSTDPNAHVDQYGDVTETLKTDSLARVIKNASVTHDENGLHLNFGGVTFDFTSSGLAVQGGNITHNGKRIDSTHIHGGVQQGSADTDVPAN